ncbi:hypothetical protein Tco_0405438 [Tanacetum coccineum]
MNTTTNAGEPPNATTNSENPNGNIPYGLGFLLIVMFLLVTLCYGSYLYNRSMHSRPSSPLPFIIISSRTTYIRNHGGNITFSQGIDDDVLVTFPTFVYSEAMMSQKGDANSSDCSICLAEYKPEDVGFIHDPRLILCCLLNPNSFIRVSTLTLKIDVAGSSCFFTVLVWFNDESGIHRFRRRRRGKREKKKGNESIGASLDLAAMEYNFPPLHEQVVSYIVDEFVEQSVVTIGNTRDEVTIGKSNFTATPDVTMNTDIGSSVNLIDPHTSTASLNSTNLVQSSIHNVINTGPISSINTVSPTSPHDNLVMAVPNLKGNEYTKETIYIEYEMDKGKGQTLRVDDEGFIKVKRKKLSGNNGCNKNIKPVSLKPKTLYRPKAKQSAEGMSNSPKTTLFVALNAKNMDIEEVVTGNKATTSGTQEDKLSTTPLEERINVLGKKFWRENLCLWMMKRNHLKMMIIQSLLEQLKKTTVDDDYDPYDDDVYEGNDISKYIQTICDDLDIKVCGR